MKWGRTRSGRRRNSVAIRRPLSKWRKYKVSSYKSRDVCSTSGNWVAERCLLLIGGLLYLRQQIQPDFCSLLRSLIGFRNIHLGNWQLGFCQPVNKARNGKRQKKSSIKSITLSIKILRTLKWGRVTRKWQLPSLFLVSGSNSQTGKGTREDSYPSCVPWYRLYPTLMNSARLNQPPKWYPNLGNWQHLRKAETL
jgi:hypothetical protein